ncbi:uncharacterized protein [Drosophila tropicalis]|uniref:uncharacterized protein n=1 Tax=Drosophila tropicalis TaxID=46794 RepID=UPI0035ABB61D
MNILQKSRLLGAKPFAAWPREKCQCPWLLDRNCLKNKITKLAFPSEASDAFFRESWNYHATDCQTRLRNIRRGIWQNIDNAIPFHKRKASSALPTFLQEPRLKSLLCHAPENNLNVDRVYKEFLKCFHPQRCLAKAKKMKAKPEPKNKPMPKPTIKPFSNKAVETHCKFAPTNRKHRFASSEVFKHVTDKQLAEWEKEANETKDIINQTKNPYVIRELTKRLQRLNKLKEWAYLNTHQMERIRESMPKRKRKKKLFKKKKKRTLPEGPHSPGIDVLKRFQIEHPNLKNLPKRLNGYPLPTIRKNSAKDSVSTKDINVGSSNESSIYLDSTPKVSTNEDRMDMDKDPRHSHKATRKSNTKYTLQILEELPKPPNIDTKEIIHLEISKSRIVSTVKEPHIQGVEATSGNDKNIQDSIVNSSTLQKLKKSVKLKRKRVSKLRPSQKSISEQKIIDSEVNIPNLETPNVTFHVQLPQENSESTLDQKIEEFLNIQLEQNQSNDQIFDEKGIEHIKPAILEATKRALKSPIEKDNDNHSEEIQNLTQIKINSKFRNDLSSFLRLLHQDETKNLLDKSKKFKGSRESVRTSELNLITPISGKHSEHHKRITLPEPKRLRILTRSFNKKIVYKNPYGKGRKLTPEQLATLSKRPKGRLQTSHKDTKKDEDTTSLYSIKSLNATQRPIYSNKSPGSCFSDVKSIAEETQYPLPEAKPMIISELVADFMSKRKMEDYFNNLYPGVIKPLLEDETPTNSDPGLINPLPFDRPPTKRFHLEPNDFPIPKPSQKPSPPIILEKRKKQRVYFRKKTEPIKSLDTKKEMCSLCKLIYGSSQETLTPCPRYMKNMQRRVEKLQLRNYFVQKMLENAKMQPASSELKAKDQNTLDRQALSSSYTALKLCPSIVEHCL